MSKNEMYTYKQETAFLSPRPINEVVGQRLWHVVWLLMCGWTPKVFNGWRLFWLKLFGAKIFGKPFVYSTARILVPWNLTMHDRAALGDRANAYTLGEIELKSGSTIAQEAYLCAATHDFADLNLPLQTAKITIGEDVFVGARAFVLPGVTIGRGSVIGACSVVTRDVAEWVIAAGNPCKLIKPRIIARQDQNP